MAEVIMPKMGDAMTEGKLLRWLKRPGEPVARGEPIAEIETDKVNVEIEAEWDGTLAQVLVSEGQATPVGAPIAFITRPGESAVGARPATAAASAPGPAAPPAPRPPAQETSGDQSAAVRASPLARRLAEQHGIPLAAIRGTGPGGRITKEDVEAAMAGPQPAVPAPPAGAPAAATLARDVPLSRMRQAIARRMGKSKRTAPHFYLTASVTMDAALAMRRQLNEGLPEDEKISVNDLIVKAAALALVRYPNLNASFAEAEGVIRQAGEVNVGIAVALPEGLIVPTLYGCDHKPLRQIATEGRALAERARAGRLRAEDLTGGTFTVSNLGMFEIDTFAAIINPPQAAILAVGAARPQPVVRDGGLAVATVMQATLSADHRVTDGAEAARFLGEIRRLLENPIWLVVNGAGA